MGRQFLPVRRERGILPAARKPLGTPRVVHGDCRNPGESATDGDRHGGPGRGLNLSQSRPRGHIKPSADAQMTKIRFDDFVEEPQGPSAASPTSAILAPPSREDVEAVAVVP